MYVDKMGYVVNRLYVIQSKTLVKIEETIQEYGCHYLVTRKYINTIECMKYVVNNIKWNIVLKKLYM